MKAIKLFSARTFQQQPSYASVRLFSNMVHGKPNAQTPPKEPRVCDLTGWSCSDGSPAAQQDKPTFKPQQVSPSTSQHQKHARTCDLSGWDCSDVTVEGSQFTL